MSLSLMLERGTAHPILSPTALPWENAAVCNPAALFHNGKTHLFYRAISKEGISSIGHASSTDGLSDWERHPEPVLVRLPSDPYQTLGVEDPRITWLEGQAHLSYTLASVYSTRAPKPWDAGTAWRVRVGLSVSDDLSSFTPPRVVLHRRDSKNAVLFPQKVNGRYVMFHRQYPDVWIAFSEDGWNWTGHRPVMCPRAKFWDSERVGSGPPPILTDYGWLLLYHGTEIEEAEFRVRRYRAGLALFERDEPWKLIARSPQPIFEPETDYEAPFRVADWHIHVVFPTGWVDHEGQTRVYYGAGDTQIGAATVSTEALHRYAAALYDLGQKR